MYSDSQALANNLSNVLQYEATTSNPFDFDDTTVLTGFYRLGNTSTYKNSPYGGNVAWGNVIVSRVLDRDTLSMFVLPFDTSTVIFKSGSIGTWKTNSWKTLVSKDDIPTRYGNTGFVIPAGKSCKISAAMDAVFTALVCVQGKSGNGSGTFIISGYGLDGGTSRYRVQDLNTSAALSRITCVVGDGTFFTVNNGTSVSVYLVIEEFFNQGEFTCSII